MAIVYSMLLLLCKTICILDIFTIVSTDSSKYLLAEVENINDGEKFIKEIIDGKKPANRPEHLLFTAPFVICKGECKSNVSNFIMRFPIHIGLKRNQKIYQALYPRDHKSIYSSRDNAPFTKSITRVPYTLCPTYTPSSNERIKEPFMPVGCPVRSILMLLSTNYFKVHALLSWDRWSWSVPQETIEHFFRRYDTNIMPIKTPDIKCQCPPNKECSMEYEINEDMIYFQNLQGVIKDEELMELKEAFNKINYRRNKNVGKKCNRRGILTRKRRLSDVILGSKEITKDCCCPTKIVKIPAFITNKKFDEVIERLNKKLV